MSGVYIHIPFCKQACNYCDFHFSTQLNSKPEMVNAIVKEIDLRKEYLKPKQLESVYFGGGTPSLLTTFEIEKILDKLRFNYSLTDSAEITLEANPDDITTARLKEWQRIGINRLSIGLQSFNDDELRWMNRVHNAQESVRSVKTAQDSGLDNITIDLIYGSKFQTLKSWQSTLQQALGLQTNHISSYNLTIENKTLLGTSYNKGTEPAVNDELSSSQFLLMVDILEENKFIQYEISNFGKQGFFAKHNTNYWLGKHYLGLGPSAHSYNTQTRQWNMKNNAHYIKKINSGETFFEVENLTLKDKYNEYVLTRLRTIFGCDIEEMKLLFDSSVIAHFLSGINLKKDLFIYHEGKYTLNRKAKLYADGIASDLFLT